MIHPFDSTYAETIFWIQGDPDYAPFFRNFHKLLTLDECKNVDKIFGAEYLAFYDTIGGKQAYVGLVSLGYLPHGVCEFGYLIFANHRGKGHTKKLLSEVFYYLKKKGMRKVICHVLAHDNRVARLCRAAEFKECGVFERHSFSRGEYADVVVYEKFL